MPWHGIPGKGQEDSEVGEDSQDSADSTDGRTGRGEWMGTAGVERDGAPARVAQLGRS